MNDGRSNDAPENTRHTNLEEAQAAHHRDRVASLAERVMEPGRQLSCAACLEAAEPQRFFVPREEVAHDLDGVLGRVHFGGRIAVLGGPFDRNPPIIIRLSEYEQLLEFRRRVADLVAGRMGRP